MTKYGNLGVFYLVVCDSAIDTCHFAAHQPQGRNVVHSAVSHKPALVERNINTPYMPNCIKSKNYSLFDQTLTFFHEHLSTQTTTSLTRVDPLCRLFVLLG